MAKCCGLQETFVIQSKGNKAAQRNKCVKSKSYSFGMKSIMYKHLASETIMFVSSDSRQDSSVSAPLNIIMKSITGIKGSCFILCLLVWMILSYNINIRSAGILCWIKMLIIKQYKQKNM